MAQNNSTLYFLSYNNYYNRIVKQEENLDSYLDYQAKYQPLVCNFNPADGVDTEHIMNTPYLANGPEADYVVVVNENNEIVSRWFIVEADRLRGGQYRLVLHRDLVVDFFEDIVNAPAYVERAMCNTGNNLIFNSENLLVNQIKQRETLLKDKTGCPWIVGYIASSLEEDKQIDASSANIAKPTVSEYTYEEWQNFQSKGVLKIDSVSFSIIGKNQLGNGVFQFTIGSRQEYKKIGSIADFSTVTLEFPPVKVGSNQGPKTLETLQTALEANKTSFGNDVFTVCKASNTSIVLKKEEVDVGLATNGILIRDENNKTFTATLSPDGHTNQTISITSGSLYNRIVNLLYDNSVINIKGDGLRIITMTVNYTIYKATVEAYDGYVASALIKSSKVAQLQDAPYKMFCIPYPIENGTGKIKTTTGTISPNAAISMNVAMRTVIELTTANVYDLQLLPYCPATNFIDEDGNIDVSGLSGDGIDKYYTPIYSTDNTIISYMLWCDTSSFSTVIPNPIAVPANNIDFKVEHETSFYRLNSPNYQGSFQFKATSNRGIDYFEVNATYKPYHPYIHIAPNFKGLYGADYNDARGLVCGGDFSLPTLTDLWETYQIQNKNFLNSFNRQIENMETVYDLQREQQRIASGVGVATAGISGGASGAIAGAQFGGAPGAAIGGVAGVATGTMASAVGRKQDLLFLQLQQNEALSYTKDQFNLSLQNIQALPYSLNNISAYDINNKFFPFLEYFSCSDEEKEAVRSKITYRSMTVNAMGTIANYIAATPSYISAQLIRLDNLGDDYHVATALANEIHQGVYI